MTPFLGVTTSVLQALSLSLLQSPTPSLYQICQSNAIVMLTYPSQRVVPGPGT